MSTFIFWIEKSWASRGILKEKELERVREQTESVWEREREQRERWRECVRVVASV